MREIENVLVALVLGAVAYRDWRTKQISCLALFAMSILIVLLRIILVEDTIWSTLGGAAVGAGFFLFSKCSKESIGYGDCWLVLLLGIFLGGKTLVEGRWQCTLQEYLHAQPQGYAALPHLL